MEEKFKKIEPQNSMLNKLIEIGDLVDLLGYVDERSIESWCKKNKVPLIHIGKKIYTVADFIDRFITEKLEQYLNSNYKNADVILKAIKNDDKTEFSKLINAPVDKESATQFKLKAA